MKTLCKKSFGVFLAVLMLLSAVGVGSYSVFAANTDTEKSGATSASGDTVYFQNTGNWSKVNAYMWNEGKNNVNNKAWPGEAMTDEGDGVWSYEIKGEYDHIIFNNGSSQTGNIVYPGNSMIYKDGSWEVYDTSPLRITSFESDTKSPAYIGSAIALTTTTKTETTGVQYQYSVNSQVIRSYSANNSCVWNPASSGDYTIRVDVKDNAGNQNFREMSFTIKDPSQEEKPVFLSSNPLTGNQIKTGTATNLSVNAAGGNTGTKLLFYKYVVKDPAGEQVNTAYYTLNKNYSFTATKTGTYTVDVSVQGSDNQTITQQLKFESTQNPTDPTEDTQPTSPTVTTPSKTDPTVTTPTTATEPTTPDPGKILGDVNGDGVLNIRDSALIQKRHTGFVIDSYDETVSDFNKDGKMNVKDAVAIQKFLAKAN